MHSQNLEEKYILDYFGDYVGTFCDIGVNDGVTLSNTRALFERGWTGVCVEPSPLAFIKLKDNYKDAKGIYLYNLAIGTHNGRVKLYESGEHLGKGDVGLLSTVIEDEKERWTKEKFQEREVKCFRWKTFTNRLTIKKFDFISMDVEGLEPRILEQIDLTDVKALCIEWNSKKEFKDAYDSLTKGFKIIYTSAENLIYAR